VGDRSHSVTIEDVSSVKKKFSFDIPWVSVKEELESAYRVVGKKAKIKGFRAGKIPRKVLETYYRGEAEDEAISNIVNKVYWDAVEVNKVIPVSQPVIDQKGIEQDKNFAFTATVEVRPVIEPKDYIGLDIEKEEMEVNEEDVRQRLEELRQAYSTLEELKEDRGILEGDFATIDFEGRLGGELRKDLKAENYLLEIGSKRFIPGFEDQLVGAKAGERKDIQVTFPEDYQSTDLAGKDVEFSVTIKNIKTKNVPPLDENFIKNFDQYESLSDLQADVRKNLGDERTAGIKASVVKAIVDKLIENNPVEVPDAFVERQIYSMMLDAQRRMAMNGMDPKKAAEIAARMHDRFKGDAERRVKTSLLLESVADKETIEVTEADLDERIRSIAAGYHEKFEDVKKIYDEKDMLEDLRAEVREQKTLDFIEGKAKIKIVKRKE